MQPGEKRSSGLRRGPLTHLAEMFLLQGQYEKEGSTCATPWRPAVQKARRDCDRLNGRARVAAERRGRARARQRGVRRARRRHQYIGYRKSSMSCMLCEYVYAWHGVRSDVTVDYHYGKILSKCPKEGARGVSVVRWTHDRRSPPPVPRRARAPGEHAACMCTHG